MDQYIGKILDTRYEILERIGTGGMAQVYKAKCHWLNRFVAIKILKADLAKDEEFTKRFHEESQAIAMLSHPNIVSVYDVSKGGDPDYIVMELIEGITLKQYMQKRGGKLTWKEALHFITQILKGLSHAHSRGIIHRDIKPHNIMILRDGTVKVTDFGIARLMDPEQSSMTQEAIGSVHYISPEQARGSRVDARTDIYSAGVVLYEMLTGRLPFEGDSPMAVAVQHIKSVPLSPGDLDPSIPEALVSITMKAMSPTLKKRYLSADAMLADLEEFRKNPNISFDYSAEDLKESGEEEPTHNIGANTPTIAQVTPPHTAKRIEEEEPPVRTRRREEEEDYEEGSGVLSVVVTIVLALMLMAGAVWFLWTNVLSSFNQPEETFLVPDLRGHTLEEARELDTVKELKFTVVEGRYLNSDQYPAGQIMDQTPAPEAQVKSGGMVITVEISKGSNSLKVPDLYNKDQRVVEGMLREMGLKMEVLESTSEEITKGNIISQRPAAGTEIQPGETVTLTVSSGRALKDVVMIPVTGMSLSDAQRTLESLGLKVGEVTQEVNDTVSSGKVFFQSVTAYTKIREGSAVDLKVSSGPTTDLIDPPEASIVPTPSPTPKVEGTEPPVQTEEPVPTVPVTRVKAGTVELPDDRETVSVQVTVGGVPQYSTPQVVDTKLRFFRYSMSGSGTQEIVVYLDGMAVESYSLNFDG